MESARHQSETLTSWETPALPGVAAGSALLHRFASRRFSPARFDISLTAGSALLAANSDFFMSTESKFGSHFGRRCGLMQTSGLSNVFSTSK